MMPRRTYPEEIPWMEYICEEKLSVHTINSNHIIRKIVYNDIQF